MGFFSDLFGTEPKTDITSKELNTNLYNNVINYMISNRGTEYVTILDQEVKEARRKAAEKRERKERIRREEERRLKEREEEQKKQKATAKTEQSSEPAPKSDASADSGVKYSISPNWIGDESPDEDITPELDRAALSMDAETYGKYLMRLFYSGKINSFEMNMALLRKKETFADLLMKYVNRSGMTNAEIYKSANLSKSVFSAIFTNRNHVPKKNNIIALAIALKLNLKEAETLLMKAGYTFSNSIDTDLVAVYCINHNKYDIDEINRILYELKLPLLGSKM